MINSFFFFDFIFQNFILSNSLILFFNHFINSFSFFLFLCVFLSFGVGDAFRAGFITGLSWGLGLERCAQVGSLLATYVIETVGTQEFELEKSVFLERFEAAYGKEAKAEVSPHL